MRYVAKSKAEAVRICHLIQGLRIAGLAHMYAQVIADGKIVIVKDAPFIGADD